MRLHGEDGGLDGIAVVGLLGIFGLELAFGVGGGEGVPTFGVGTLIIFGANWGLAWIFPFGFFFMSEAGTVTGSVSVSATAEMGRSTANRAAPQPAQKVLTTKSRPASGGWGIFENEGAGPENASLRCCVPCRASWLTPP